MVKKRRRPRNLRDNPPNRRIRWYEQEIDPPDHLLFVGRYTPIQFIRHLQERTRAEVLNPNLRRKRWEYIKRRIGR